MLAEESPLNALPEGLPRTQILFYDALAHSFEAIERSYRQLQSTLTEHVLNEDELAASQRVTTVDALIAAWGMVDALHRVEKLLAHTPGLRHSPAVTSVQKSLESVEVLRHEMQHLEKHIALIAESPMPVWGFLSWVTVVDEKRVATSVLLPGHVAAGEFPVINPVGKSIQGPTDMVTLSAAGHHLNLSEQHRAVARFVERFERGAAEAWKQLATTSSSQANEIVRVDVPL